MRGVQPRTEAAVSSPSKGAHTPGPWRIANGSATGFKTASGGESILAEARPSDDYFILMIAEMVTNVHPAERVANARLIAAAPELLEALKELFPSNVCTSNPNIPDTQVLPCDVTMGELRRAHAAIAKAEGRS